MLTELWPAFTEGGGALFPKSGDLRVHSHPRINKMIEPELACCEYIFRRESTIALGHSGTGTSGFYAWQKSPLSTGAEEDARQTELILQAWSDSGKAYGYRMLHNDLLDQGEACYSNRVARLTSLAGIKAQIGLKRRPGSYGGKPSLAVHNTLDRQFDVAAPDWAWVIDITNIRALEGFAYLAVVIDLYSRRMLDLSMQSRQTTDAVLQALHMALWRRKPKQRALIHSDQGPRFTSMEWAAFTQAHNLEHSMSQRDKCHDNAVAESFSPR